jgi:hypothetical protein
MPVRAAAQTADAQKRAVRRLGVALARLAGEVSMVPDPSIRRQDFNAGLA